MTNRRKVFLTFGDGGDGFVAARKRIALEARTVGVFSEVRDCDWSDCTAEAKDSLLRQYKRGCGYWVWKPDLIWKVLETLDDGDILVWSDAGNVVCPARIQWRRLFKRLESVDLLFRRISSCGFHWQRKSLLEHFAADVDSMPRLRMCFNFEGSALLIKKSSFSMQFVSEWRSFMLSHPECVRDVGLDANDEAQLPTFVENRHDQSVLSLLAYKYLSRAETRKRIGSLWEFHQGWWLWGDPALLVARNRGGGSMRLSLKQKIKRVAYRMLWRAQQYLESRGLQICWAKYGHPGGGNA